MPRSADQSPSKHRARKRFGQNFLKDANIIEKIVRSIAPKPDDNLVEIGPGQGAITAPLLVSCPHLNVIEIDRDLIPILLAQFANHKHFKIHKEDALKFDFSKLTTNKPLRIVGNLPYNISTPLIFHLLSFLNQIKDMHFMLQKEVVERLAAQEDDSQYGRLSVMVQYYCEVDYLFDVSPECFDPKPKVDSAIVKLSPYQQLPYIASDIEVLKKLVNLCFQQRRKTLRNSLKHLLSNEQIDSLEIDTRLRPQNLSVKDYVELSNIIASYQ